MPATRTLKAVAGEIQSLANRLALMSLHRDRDTILAGLFADVIKGRKAAERLEAQAPELEALEARVFALRRELGTILDGILPRLLEPPELTDMTEPTKKRKKRK